ncbi:MAG: phenylalanine--tRNA ligase beta subunit-related protein [Planctomycetota bacterium]
MLTFAEHPLLHPAAFTTEFPTALGELGVPDWLAALLDLQADVPLQRTEELRGAARDLLRHGGYNPTGRGKPASEYLVRAAGEGALSSINAAVDACNAVSLASGVPISVVDLQRASEPFRVRIVPSASYVFNSTGQEIRLDGLLCLHDTQGPCANAVKDCQRTKTSDETTHTLSVLWGPRSHSAQVESALAWYREILARLGATTERL